jgi:protein-tyrosine phosphatase
VLPFSSFKKQRMKILMVCLGNICRSPLAHGLLRSKVGNHITVDSAGTGDWHAGEAPDQRMIRTARKHGVDISDLRARQFTIEDFDRFDRIYAMDQSNYENIVKLARSEQDKLKVQLFLSLTNPEAPADVPDPYFGGDEGFEHVYQLLDNASSLLANELKHG